MNYFESAQGSAVMESIAHSLNRIANALEENNRLLMAASQPGGKRVAQPKADAASKALKDLEAII